MNGPNFLTPMYMMHIFSLRYSSHLHKAGFLMTNLLTNPRVYEKGYINSKETRARARTHVRTRVWYSIEFSQQHHSLLHFSYFSNSTIFPSQGSLRMYF